MVAQTPGPSPRVRGKRASPRGPCPGSWSIPACAGETRIAAYRTRRAGVHPRVCGGNVTFAGDDHQVQGPSPRVRGKRHRYQRRGRHHGSIPACAGETWRRWGWCSGAWVHPRVCGGNGVSSSSTASATGPSPRVRGKRGLGYGVVAADRSIPACAGETVVHEHVRWRSAVHPRVCGGNASGRLPLSSVWGPSPRVRGKPVLRELLPDRLGSIPACAGETPGDGRGERGRGVHPRVCGGNLRYRVQLAPSAGPSPRVRGKRLLGRGAAVHGGSIPACAGETRPC